MGKLHRLKRQFMKSPEKERFIGKSEYSFIGWHMFKGKLYPNYRRAHRSFMRKVIRDYLAQ